MMMSMGKLSVQGGVVSSPIYTNHTASLTRRTDRIAFPRICNSSHSLQFSGFYIKHLMRVTGNIKCKQYHAEAEMNEGSQFEFKRSITKGDTISLNDLFTNNRDYLIKNNNQHVKAEQLEGKVIGIYFLPLSAKVSVKNSEWYTTFLKDVYDGLHPMNNFETVLVACNDLHTDFGAELLIHDSLVTPRRLFSVSATVLENTTGLPQRDYVISINGDKVPIATFEDKVVALYFHQPDDPDSVNEELKLAYEEFAKKRKIFEVVLVYIREPCPRYGSDLLWKSEESFWEEFKNMPWLALPFKDMSYKKLKRVFEFKRYETHKLVIFGPYAKYIEPFGFSTLLKYGNRAFPFAGKCMVEMEYEKLKELNLEKLWNRNNVFRRNDGSQVPFSLLLGKRVMLVLDSFDALKSISDEGERITKSITMLKEKYFLTRGTDDEFEVIRILINNTESLFYKDLVGDMPWLVSPESDLKYDVCSSRFWYGFNTFFLLNLCLPILAFDQDGRVVRKTLKAELDDMKFPFFFSGIIDEKMFAPSSTACQEDYYREIFRYNGRIYRDRQTSI